ncbi:MAG: metallophosphoesterase family protein [Clostridia bacterium]|nr:metallophosphoesterase family protein [Clostridia bacterium]
MRILAVSDVPSDRFYKYYKPGKLDGFDLILSCGDLKAEYLEFLVTMADCPLIYVHGNHDDGYNSNPEGCICAEDNIVEYKGLRILGLGGSYKYRDGDYMFTERQMSNRIKKLWFTIRKKGGFDILLTHAPAGGLNDLDTVAHKGFDCFNTLLEKYEPSYFIHGHIHRNYELHIPQKDKRGKTIVINAYDYAIIDTKEQSDE